MAAYTVLYTTEVIDEALHAEFRSRVTSMLEAKGGKFLMRGDIAEASDGDTTAHRRIAVMEFPTHRTGSRLGRPQTEPEYVALRELRDRASHCISFVIEGS